MGSRGMLSRLRRIFPRFGNPLVKTNRFRWFRAPQGLDEHEGHGQDVHGTLVPSCIVEARAGVVMGLANDQDYGRIAATLFPENPTG